MLPKKFLYLTTDLKQSAIIADVELTSFTQRHSVHLKIAKLNPIENPLANDCDGIVIGLPNGYIEKKHLKFIKQALKKTPLWCYWPKEQAIEYVDRERLHSYKKQYRFIKWVGGIVKIVFYKLLPWLINKFPLLIKILYLIRQGKIDHFPTVSTKFRELTQFPSPQKGLEDIANKTGVYLRTDFWTPITSGGSYGHTCYCAYELSRLTKDFICFLPHQYPLLDELKVPQIVLELPSQHSDESVIVQGGGYYYFQLKTALQMIKPAFIYERLCIGNYAGALISKELKIPYIVEYNGSEIAMKKSFSGSSYIYEKEYLLAEEAAFKQATAISVVSEIVKENLVKRGIPKEKILVNPNGADPNVYAPLTPDEKNKLRQEFSWDETHLVVGFTGTFGGWHGIDVLAEILPHVCKELPQVRFLLIGDGHYKHLVDETILKHSLQNQVHCTGRVPQQQGARFLQACDIFISPHSRHMADSRFFGSPTKIFEYMALSGAIIASDLEQIGEVLAPALYPKDFENPPQIDTQRSILCTPANAQEVIAAIVFLAKNPDICKLLGTNARKAVLEEYSWQCHIARLLAFIPKVKEKRKEQKQEKQEIKKRTLEYFLALEKQHYIQYPWMPKLLDFSKYSQKKILELDSNHGTDLAQFAKHGNEVSALSKSDLVKENFQLRQLRVDFTYKNTEQLPFANDHFDLIYSIKYSSYTDATVKEIYRVLKPGAHVVFVVYAENSWRYWVSLLLNIGIKRRFLEQYSMGAIVARHINEKDSLGRVYTKKRLQKMFAIFNNVKIYKQRFLGWHLLVKAKKP